MKLVKFRKMARGDRVLCVPDALAKKIDSGYFSVELANGKLIYTPVFISEAK
jgi:hypothetical protein